MTCPRCGGWVYADLDPTEPGQVCINCGHRPPQPSASKYPIKLPPKTSSEITPKPP